MALHEHGSLVPFDHWEFRDETGMVCKLNGYPDTYSKPHVFTLTLKEKPAELESIIHPHPQHTVKVILNGNEVMVTYGPIDTFERIRTMALHDYGSPQPDRDWEFRPR